MKPITGTKKNLIIIGGVVLVILLLVRIVGWNKIGGIFIKDQKEKIESLQERIRMDSSMVVLLQIKLKQQQDSVKRYQDLYHKAKDNYVVVTKYYEKKVQEVKGLPAKEAIAYFHEQTDCEDTGDTTVITRLSSIMCANIKFVERDMYLNQRDTLQGLNDILELEIGSLNRVAETQQQVIIKQEDQLKNYSDIVATQGQVMSDLEKANKKAEKKLKRAKFMTIICGSAAVVLGAVLILQ